MLVDNRVVLSKLDLAGNIGGVLTSEVKITSFGSRDQFDQNSLQLLLTAFRHVYFLWCGLRGRVRHRRGEGQTSEGEERKKEGREIFPQTRKFF